jgi:hypothetical protein
MPNEIKTRFAYDKSDNPVDIFQLDKESGGNQKYHCQECGEPIIARLGNIRQHHFAHNNPNCSRDRRLHTLAEDIFLKVYSDCNNSENRTPFKIELNQPHICKYKQSSTGENCSCLIPKEYDLIAHFPIIQKEIRKANFTVDILLSKEKGGCIFTEMAVTHKCTDEKKNSGNRIIEITIEDENDIDIVLSKYLSYKNPKIVFYNFKPVTVEKPFCLSSCSLPVLMVLYNDGTAALYKKYEDEETEHFKNRILRVLNTQSEKFIAHTVLDNQKIDIANSFASFLFDCIDNGSTVESCAICRFYLSSDPEFERFDFYCQRRNYNFMIQAGEYKNCRSYQPLRTAKP